MEIIDPPITKKFFNNYNWSLVWVPIRLFLGYTWLHSGIGKAGNAAGLSGEAIKGFFSNSLGTAGGKPVIAYGFYRDFIQAIYNSGQFQTWAYIIMIAELVIGICLILGAFTGIAAFIGGFMNWNFMMAGTASINPLLFLFSVLLVLAWKTAGHYGLDRWLLPKLGTPWQKKIRKS